MYLHATAGINRESSKFMVLGWQDPDLQKTLLPSADVFYGVEPAITYVCRQSHPDGPA
jgi:hypothetical protein